MQSNIAIPYGKTHLVFDQPYDGLLTSRVDQLRSEKSGLELVEAARMDGATRMKIIWHVYLPHLRPTIILLLIL